MNLCGPLFSRFLGISVLLLGGISVGCSSGGGDDAGGFVGAARVSMTVSPNSIDSRDRTKVTVTIEQVIDTGIILKLRYPNKLAFSVNTAKLQLETEDEGRSVEPAHNADNDDTTYLVFFLPRSLFGDTGDDEVESEPARLTLELVGLSRLRESRIEVDADVNDPTIDDSVEFDINDPAFEAEAEATIEVRESRS